MDFAEQIEKVLKEVAEKAKQDHAAGTLPDASSLITPIVPHEVDSTKIQEVVSQLKVLSGTKSGLAKVITLLNLVMKYAAKI